MRYKHPKFMNPTRLPYTVELTAKPILALFDLAVTSARRAARQGRRRRHRNRGHTLHPGSGTPLWNELVDQVRPNLLRHGSKAHLARLLGVPRQRIQDCLKAGTACLDAERTLLLLCWLVARQNGRDLLV